MVSTLAATTVDCIDCVTTSGATGNQITLANARSLSSTVVEIDERATQLGCSMIRTNRDYSMLENGLRMAGYTTEEFFQNATCELNVTTSRIDHLKPLKYALAEPSARRQMILSLLRHLDGLGDRQLVREVLNHVDNGMTTLDYLDYLYTDSFSGDSSARRDLDYLRTEFCRRGGEYRSRNKSCSTSA
jgi:hypothetical protein